MNKTYHSIGTKVLHLILAAAVVHQLLISLLMQAPGRGRAGDSLFELHELGGLLSLATLVIFFIWTATRKTGTPTGLLFPWASPQRMRALAADIRLHVAGARRGTLPVTESSPLASATHGLGLLIALLMAATGAAGYFLEVARPLLGVHETVAPLMWAYLIGHAGLAVLHQLAGHRILQRMFRLQAGDKRGSSARQE